MRFLLTTLCLGNPNGHLLDTDTGRCLSCETDRVVETPYFESWEKDRYEELRTEYLHEQRALERQP